MSRCVNIALILCIAHTMCWLASTVSAQPVAKQDTAAENITIERTDVELGDLATYDVIKDGKPYVLVRRRGYDDMYIPFNEYYAADLGDEDE